MVRENGALFKPPHSRGNLPLNNELERPDMLPGQGGGGFLAREWIWLLLVVLAVVLLLSLLLVPAPEVAVEGEAAEAALSPSTAEIMSRLDARPGLKIFILCYAGGGLLLFLAGLPTLGWFLWQRIEGVPFLGRREDGPVRWGLWDVIKAAAVYFLLIQGLGWLVLMAAPGMTADLTLVVVLCGNLLVTLFIVLLAAGRDAGWRRSLGLAVDRFWLRARDGLVGYVAFFPLLIVTALVAVLVAFLFSLEPEQNPLVPMVLGSDSFWFLAFLFIFGGLVGPVTEEVFFRGFFYPALRQRVGRMAAIGINAFCFAALHGNLIQLAPLLGLGLILALLRERTGSVVASTVLHCVHNTLVLILLLALKPVLF